MTCRITRSALGPLALLALALGACSTITRGEWRGGATTPFGQAHESCERVTREIQKEGNERPFFIGCMKALGWTPTVPHPRIEGIDRPLSDPAGATRYRS